MRTSHMRNLILTLVIAAFGVVGSAHAGIITVFNNFGPGNAYDPSQGRPIGTGVDDVFAVPFTPGVNSSLSSLLLPLTGEAAPVQTSGNIFVSVLKDDGSNLPCCTVLETFIVDSTTLSTFGGPPVTLASVVKPFLSSGTQYWVEVGPTPSNGGVYATWNWPSPHVVGPEWSSMNGISNGVTTEFQAALQVNGTVPEPKTLALFTFGAIALAFFSPRLRRRKG
jgi:hypothetical protein